MKNKLKSWQIYIIDNMNLIVKYLPQYQCACCIYKKVKHNPYWNKNLFVRTNKDFTQFILIRPTTITNPKKLVRTQFQPNNSDEVENWLSFRKEGKKNGSIFYLASELW